MVGLLVAACLGVVAGAGVVAVTGRPLWLTGGGGDGERPAGYPSTPSAQPTQCAGQVTVSELLVPSCGAWFGVAPGALTPRSRPSALRAFERKVGRTLDIVHTYHRGGEVFPTDNEMAMAREPGDNHLLYINWKPQMDRTWAEVAAGDPEVDAHIDEVAERIKRRLGDERFFLTIHHEPENDVRPFGGSGFTARDYRAMFRYVVQRLRDRGVTNAVFVMNYMGYPKWCVKDWFPRLYPGDDVVDWISYDPYAGKNVTTLEELVNKRMDKHPSWPGFYDWAAEKHQDKPLMLSEWGVFGSAGHKTTMFRDVRAHIREYPRLRGLMYFASPNAPKGDTTIDESQSSLRAFRGLTGLPYLDPPQPVR